MSPNLLCLLKLKGRLSRVDCIWLCPFLFGGWNLATWVSDRAHSCSGRYPGVSENIGNQSRWRFQHRAPRMLPAQAVFIIMRTPI